MTLKNIAELLNNKVANLRILNTETLDHYLILTKAVSNHYFQIELLHAKHVTSNRAIFVKDDDDKFFLLSSPEEIIIKAK